MERRRERLDSLQHRLGTALQALIATPASCASRRHRERVHAFSERALRAIENLLDNRDLRLERAGQLLTAFSYRGVLERGFALVRDASGSPLRRGRGGRRPARRLDIEFADGRVRATAEGAPALAAVAAGAAAPAAPPGARAKAKAACSEP